MKKTAKKVVIVRTMVIVMKKVCVNVLKGFQEENVI
jgi:hypothetical protein